MKTTEDIKREIAAIQNLNNLNNIKCGNCKYWGANNGKLLYSTGDSRCKIRKEKTFKLSFCSKFEVI